MKAWCLAVAVALAAGALAGPRPAEAGAAGAQPRIVFSETEWDFGTLWQGENATRVFTFRNAGDAPLLIEQVKSTCGCTAAMPEVRELAPGESTSLNVTFRSAGMRGRMTKHVHVDSNDPSRPRVTLTIRGEVKVEVQVSPRGVYIGQAKPGEKVERTVELTPVDVPDFRILSVTSDSPAVRVGAPQPLGGKRPGYRIAVTIGPLEREGRVSAKVTVRTNLERTKEVVIPVYGRIRSDAQ